MNFFNKVKLFLQKHLNGRYGSDAYNIFLLVISLIMMNIKYVWILSYVILAYVIYRTLSKDIVTRKKELDWYNEKIGYSVNRILRKTVFTIGKLYFKIKKMYRINKTKIEQRDKFIFFKCKECNKMLRVPRKKGKIKVTCPVCKTTMVKKT